MNKLNWEVYVLLWILSHVLTDAVPVLYDRIHADVADVSQVRDPSHPMGLPVDIGQLDPVSRGEVLGEGTRPKKWLYLLLTSRA